MTSRSARPTFLYKADLARGRQWAEIFARRAPELDFRLWPDIGDPAAVRFLAAWEPPADLADRFPNLQLLFSSGAGVDQFDFTALPQTLPIVRMVEPGIVQGMVEYVSHAVLGLHRDSAEYRRQQQDGVWRPLQVKTAAERRVGVLGLGSLGQAVLAALLRFGFDCAGWSRSRHALDGVQCFAGADELPTFLARTDILVCLLPLTAQTRGIVNAETLGALRAGAALVNFARGPIVDDAALRSALDAGRVSHAVLDVFDREPLPADAWQWAHPNVTVLPHISAATDPSTASAIVAANVRRYRETGVIAATVDRAAGY